jgi:hypothetical protein
LVIETKKPLRKQTKYHAHCAQIMKTRNTLPSWPPDKRRDYMCDYMQRYRHRKQSSSNAAETQLDSPGNRATFVIGLPLIISLLSENVSSWSVIESVLSLIRNLQISRYWSNGTRSCGDVSMATSARTLEKMKIAISAMRPA